MRSYLSIEDSALECEACGRKAGPGVTGWTEAIVPGTLVAVCHRCLCSLDPELWRLAILPRCLDVILRLVDPEEETAQLAEQVREAWGVLRNCLPEEPGPSES